MNQSLMFICNVAWFFISHRLNVARECVSRGWDVKLVSGASGSIERDQLRAEDIEVTDIHLERSRFGLSDAIFLWKLIFHFRRERPSIVHLVTIKPVILGGLAARVSGVRAVVFAISGLGYTFIAEGWRSRLRRRIVIGLYKVALRHPNSRVIFQNPEDLRLFKEWGIVVENQAIIIEGAGVDTDEFRPTPLKPGRPVFLVAARMLKDKGVLEFASAAKVLGDSGFDWRFVLVGDVDEDNPASLNERELRQLEVECGVEWHGATNDIAAAMREAHVVCLLSYREGMPKSLLEAAAAGRAIIATDVAGCRDVVRDGVNGILVRRGDLHGCVLAMRLLGEQRDLCEAMGAAGRKFALSRWSSEIVVDKTIRVYESLLS